jgi:hypothetical protein
MTRGRSLAALLALALVVAPIGCTGSGAQKNDSPGASGAGLPEAFAGDADKAADLEVTADGGSAVVVSGDATVALNVPAGAAPDGAAWVVTPLLEAPDGVERALCPGVYVDTAGGDPTDWCAIGFSLPGSALPNATIVRLADDGTVAEIIPTARMEYGDRTFLTGYVDGFSAYTTSEEDAAARDKAAVDRANAKGQQVDWTLKVAGTETQEISGWTFSYEVDIFASGGDVGQGGTYTGTAMLYVEGTYSGPETPYYQTMGSINAIGRDQALTFTMIDPPLASLLTGVGGDMPAADGVMNLTGMADLSISATGVQGEQGQVGENDVESTDAVDFTLKVTTFEDVQLEIDNVGIFAGKILRTTK